MQKVSVWRDNIVSSHLDKPTLIDIRRRSSNSNGSNGSNGFWDPAKGASWHVCPSNAHPRSLIGVLDGRSMGNQVQAEN